MILCMVKRAGAKSNAIKHAVGHASPWDTNATRRALLSVALPIACLLLCINKAFHIDDTMYLWAAQQIQQHPLDFYGFDVNWHGMLNPMYEENENPPLVSYYIALVALVSGFHEIPLHLAFLIPAALVTLGTFVLARRWCANPHLAALAAALSPVFLVSGSNVMSDMLMMCFFIWAIVLWVEGIDCERSRYLYAAGVLMAFAFWSKYFGVALIPLCLSYAVLRRRVNKHVVAALFIPVGAVVLYDVYTNRMYGKPLFIGAAIFAGSEGFEEGLRIAPRTFTGLAFLGGCLSIGLFWAPLIWRWYGLAIGAAMAAVFALFSFGSPAFGGPDADGDLPARWGAIVQVSVWAATGVSLIGATIALVCRRRDAESIFVALWIFGTLVFAIFLNWSMTARTLLPLTPALGIVLVLQLEHRHADFARVRYVAIGAMALSAVLSLIVLRGDVQIANSQRAAAEQFLTAYGKGAGNLHFQGHWGFQWYMEQGGAIAMDKENGRFRPGDRLISPLNNSINAEPRRDAPNLEVRLIPGASVATTVNTVLRAGFYSDVFGPLPFAFGIVPDDIYVINKT